MSDTKPRDPNEFFTQGELAIGWCEPETSKTEMDVHLCTAITKCANRIIRDHLATCPRMYGCRGEFTERYIWSDHQTPADDREAYLFGVRKIGGAGE